MFMVSTNFCDPCLNGSGVRLSHRKTSAVQASSCIGASTSSVLDREDLMAALFRAAGRGPVQMWLGANGGWWR
jgi:hypothetical protein